MDAMRRSVRLNRLQELFRGSKRGYTAQQLARLTGVHVRTIQRDLIVLQNEMGMPLDEQDGRYSPFREETLRPLELTLQQARALLIAARLFIRHSDEGDPYAAGALMQLASILPEPVRDSVRAGAESLAAKPIDADFARNLATVTDAWARRRQLRISYRSSGRQRPKDVVLEPYFIEPSAAGFATYVIGYSQTHGAMRTFKVERIVSAEMLPRAFETEPRADIEELLASAWGIIWGEGVQVRLRFAPDVAWRVKETVWHPSQQVDDLPDGACLLTLSVASMMELGRWVRSWGDKVEVLAPAALREELRLEAVRLARTYAGKARPVRVRRRDRSSTDEGAPGSVA